MIGETLQLISDIVGVVADFCILVITVFTLYLTVFASKLSMISMGMYYSAFYGDNIRIFLKNKSLHSIPIKKVFLLKEIEGIFYYIELKVYEDPLIIDSWHITRISTDPFTEITGIERDTSDIHINAVLGVDMGGTCQMGKAIQEGTTSQSKKSL
ncbi:MAG: hypothetical protein PUG10_01725 [Lachnospiraceae bacterium]|nr:hypothetical protein [Lachnospiraceae bacterium]